MKKIHILFIRQCLYGNQLVPLTYFINKILKITKFGPRHYVLDLYSFQSTIVEFTPKQATFISGK